MSSQTDVLEFVRWALEQGYRVSGSKPEYTYHVRNEKRHVVVHHTNNELRAWGISMDDLVLRRNLRDAEDYLMHGRL